MKMKICVVCGKPFKKDDYRGYFGKTSRAAHQSCINAENRKIQRKYL
jgi:hypothetical protein